MQSKKLVQAADSEVSGTVAHSLKSALNSLCDLESVGDVRGLGLLWAVEFVADKKTKKPLPPEKNFAGLVGQACRQRGLLVYPMQGCVDGIAGDHLLIAPPAVITADQIAWAVEQLRVGIQSCC
jgi:adenosylmethionine-8-amino-7-oxononanoate aminotransferase